MAVLCMATEVLSLEPVLNLVEKLNGRIGEHRRGDDDVVDPHICVTTDEADMPFRVHSASHVTISVARLEEVCGYLGMTAEDYLFLCYLLGTAQQKALDSNGMLRPEDLAHPEGSRCLFNTHGGTEDYVVQLDNPVVCRGCCDFYHVLGCDGEMILIQEALQEVRAQARHGGEVPKPGAK